MNRILFTTIISLSIFFLFSCKYQGVKEQNFSSPNNPPKSRVNVTLEDLSELDKDSCDWVEILLLAYEDYRELPEVIFELENLKELSIFDCLIDSIDIRILRLEKLEKLDLTFNPITYLSPELGQMNNLKSVYLDTIKNFNNKLPENISELKQIKSLSLGGNHFLEFPEVVFELSSLESLKMSSCSLEEIPRRIGELDKLKKLYIANNKLKTLPIELFNIETIELIDIRGNKFDYEYIEYLESTFPDIVFQVTW